MDILAIVQIVVSILFLGILCSLLAMFYYESNEHESDRFEFFKRVNKD